MKKKLFGLIMASAVICSAAVPFNGTAAAENTETVSYNYSYDMENGYTAENAHTRRMEKLDRGLAGVKTDEGVYLSWRLWDSEDARYGSAESDVSFNIYRDGEKIASVRNSTNFVDRDADGTGEYCVAPVVNGIEGEKCENVSVWENNYIDLDLRIPEKAVLPDGSAVEYEPGDTSCGDLDGDGEYELVVKWNAGTSSEGMYSGGFDGPVLLDAYKLDGTKLWKQPINLGVNVYADEHNTQFLVYDFDGDGKAEITCQTSAGSMDANGNYVNTVSENAQVRAIDNTEDYRDENGRILTGAELFTIFDGETGSAVDTIYYPIPICDSAVWGDGVGNRSTRFLADVSYLDGENPYAVYWRGYYTGGPNIGRTGVFGAGFDGKRLNIKYIFDSYNVLGSEYADSYTGIPAYTEGNEKYIGQGNHNITTADVDNDGKDEFMSGALCFEVNDEDKLMPKWCSFRGHGDALSLADYDPTHKGMEYFSVHETGDIDVTMPDGTQKELDYGMTVYDAATGEELFHISGDSDTKRGIMSNSGEGGYYQISATTGVGEYIAEGNGKFTKSEYSSPTSFRLFWDGDLYDEYVGSTVTDWVNNAYQDIFISKGSTGTYVFGNKPALYADLFGDWRDEIVFLTTDKKKLRIFTTTEATNYKIKTLMHDPVYRSGVAAYQTATNMSPYVGFYMGKELFDEEIPEIEIKQPPIKTIYAPGETLNTKGLVVTAHYENNSAVPITDYELSGYDANKAGDQTVTVTYMGKTAEFTVTVDEVTEISVSREPDNTVNYEGAQLNTDGLIVTARYSSGAEAELFPEDYTVSYTPELGEQTVTVTYMEKAASFKVTVVEADIAILNRTYFTDSTESSQLLLPIGALGGKSFTLEHTVKIHSVPADCGNDKNDTNGFFLRFMNMKSSQSAAKTGGGWYLQKYGDAMALYWKGSGVLEYDKIGNLEVGKTYKFKYDFVNIGTGSDNDESPEEKWATATLTVTDENGEEIGSVSGLPLRNFTGKTGNTLPINTVQIYNRANLNSEASVTIGDASVHGTGEIMSLIGNEIKLNVSGAADKTFVMNKKTSLIAAKYDNGVLSETEIFDGFKIGENELTASFVPDRVFLWNDMRPLCEAKNAGARLTVKLKNENNSPISGAEITVGEQTALTDSDGTAVLELDFGKHAFSVLAENYEGDIPQEIEITQADTVAEYTMRRSYEPVLTELKVSGPETVLLSPPRNIEAVSVNVFSAAAYDQYGYPMPDCDITWQISEYHSAEEDEYVTIDNGTVTVKKGFTSVNGAMGRFIATVSASHNDISLEIYRRVYIDNTFLFYENGTGIFGGELNTLPSTGQTAITVPLEQRTEYMTLPEEIIFEPNTSIQLSFSARIETRDIYSYKRCFEILDSDGKSAAGPFCFANLKIGLDGSYDSATRSWIWDDDEMVFQSFEVNTWKDIQMIFRTDADGNTVLVMEKENVGEVEIPIASKGISKISFTSEGTNYERMVAFREFYINYINE